MDDSTQVLKQNLVEKLEAANKQLDNAMARIIELEERLKRNVLDVEDVPVLDDVPAGQALSAKWEWMTICDDPKSAHREDAKIAECLNDGWQIHSIQFAQSAVSHDGVLEIQRTRVVNLQRVKFSELAPLEPKSEGKEITLSEPIPAEEPVAEDPLKETVLEFEPVTVVQVLPENMVIVDCLPDDLVTVRDEFAHLSYEQALKNPFTTAEDLAAIHKKETKHRVGERVDFIARWQEDVAAWKEKWAKAENPFQARDLQSYMK